MLNIKSKIKKNSKTYRAYYKNSKLCMDHRNKIKVPDPVVKDLTSKK